MIAALRLEPKHYYNALHFYRSDGYETSEVYEKWIEIAIKESTVQRIGGRILTIGDHVKISKEGRRMPGIQILHQESQNSGKPEIVEGHLYGHVSAVITNGNDSRSLPLLTQLHKVPPKDAETQKPIGDTIVVQMMNTVNEAAKCIGEPVLTALDAYFCKASTFNSAGESVEVVVRAACDTVAFVPPNNARKTVGRPKLYGDKIKLYDLFYDMSDFTTTTLTLYGKSTKVNYKLLDLIWKPLGRTIRFVAVDSYMGKMVLMTECLTLSAEDMIVAYAFRYKIEPGFNELKNTMGGFSYRFWTTAIPKRKRWSKSSQEVRLHESDKKILAAKSATEAFVCTATIATGILTIIAFSHNVEIWNRYRGWIRTRCSSIPSIAVAKDVIAQDFPDVLEHSSTLMGFNFIKSLRRSFVFFYSHFYDESA